MVCQFFVYCSRDKSSYRSALLEIRDTRIHILFKDNIDVLLGDAKETCEALRKAIDSK